MQVECQLCGPGLEGREGKGREGGRALIADGAFDTIRKEPAANNHIAKVTVPVGLIVHLFGSSQSVQCQCCERGERW